MRKNYSFLLYTLLIFSIAGCKKYSFEDNGLPATTTKGAHTFGALIENKPWVPGKNASGYQNLWGSVSAAPTGGYFFNCEAGDGHISIRIHIANINDKGIYYFNNDYNDRIQYNNRFYFTDNNIAAVIICTPTDYDEYKTGTLAKGKIIITRFDVLKKIISGEFEFNGSFINSKNETIIKPVTSGRFDISIL